MINIDIDNGIKINIYRYLKMKIVFMQQSRSNVRLSQQKVAQCNIANPTTNAQSKIEATGASKHV